MTAHVEKLEECCSRRRVSKLTAEKKLDKGGDRHTMTSLLVSVSMHVGREQVVQ